MPIDHFTREQFEAELPCDKHTGNRLWQWRGIIGNEHCYLMPVTEHSGLLIRSSVHPDGRSADTGEDSIRVMVVRSRDLASCGSKLQKYTTRVPGWEGRLTELLRRMWPMAKLTGPCQHKSIDPRSREEHVCGGWVAVFKCRKADSPNKGRLFRSCDSKTCPECSSKGKNKCQFYEWITPLPMTQGTTK